MIKQIFSNRLLLALMLLLIATILYPKTVFAANSSLSKTGYDTLTNSYTQTTTGNITKWVISYNNLSDTPVGAQIDDVIPTNTQFVPGSLQLPQGWNSSYSSDNGDTYGSSDTGFSTTNLSFRNPTVDDPSTGLATTVSQPLSTTAQSGTGEDAYTPISYKNRYLGIVHHSTQPGNEIVCSSQISGACDGYPVALDLSGQTDFYTSINPLYYLEKDTGRLFFAAQRDVGYGIVCWDLNNDQMCAGNEYTELSSTGAKLGTDQPSRLLGVVEDNGCLYAWDNNLVMYSLDPNTFSTNCGGFGSRNLATAYSLPVYVPSQHNLLTSNYGPVASAQAIGNKIYFPINYSFRSDVNFFCGLSPSNYCENSRLVCFDPTVTDGSCSGWTTPSIGGANNVAQVTTGVFEDYIQNNPCVFFIDITSASTSTLCYQANTGTAASVPPNLSANVVAEAAALGTNTLAGSYEEVTTTNTSGDLITVFPFNRFSSDTISGAAGCYNWTLQDECTGWGSTGDGETTWTSWGSSTDVNGGNTRDYGYSIDENGCLLGLGDAGWLWSFGADDGSVPCLRSLSSFDITPSSFYCDGSGNVNGWNTVKISNTILR